MNNNGLLKVILAGLLVLYVVSPMDLAPGAIDDLLLILFSAAMNSRKQGTDRVLPPGASEEYRQS